MSTKASEPEAAETAELTDVQVIGFLRENPDFLERYPQLLSVIAAPERGSRMLTNPVERLWICRGPC